MASAVSISRLHAVNNLTPQGVTRPEPVKTDIMSDSQPDLLALQTLAWQQPLRRRFGSPTRSRNGAPALMSTGVDTSIPAGRSFSDVAMRDAAQQMRATAMRRYSQRPRGAAGHQQHGMAIQI
jgi:hypothetical protein